MVLEHPMMFYYETAQLLGISDSELCERLLPVYYRPDSLYGIFPEQPHQLFQYSVRRNGLMLIAALPAGLDAGETLVKSLKDFKVATMDSYFALEGRGFLGMNVRDGKILKPHLYRGIFPRDEALLTRLEPLFAEGAPYEPALKWMLEEYAGRHHDGS